ncbi:hypothetical protein [Streptomyces sp. NBC_01294]|uniref:hypothetical protein n=1 Tax=Streptomyces sp. NBC_01294 TaxID=2903815 RepID=UPI002DDAEDE1|nr:hypothetical protein [Streptomyces sp. NBC_01294]WRZ57925.1 hypothetical protein OG534_16320 [Streptomyces sp. NBC_01294]
MSGNAPVDPGEVPVFTGDLAVLDAQVKAISSGGAAVSTATSDVHTSFGGLQAFYQAPEADQLFATTKPVQDLGLKLSSDMCTIAGALGTYSRDAAPVIKRLENLKAEAQAFRTKTDKDEKWREDGDLIDENLARRNEIAEVWEQFHEVERAAHAKIVALVGGKPLRVNDGSNAPDMYGYDAEALKQAKSLPWGDAVEESIPGWQFWEHGWEFTKGFFVDGVWGTLKGLGGLVGLQGWDVFKQSWAGLGKLGTGLGIMMIPGAGAVFMALPDDKLPSYLRESRTAMKETGKALLAWDQWGSNPGRAAGAVTFNVVTTVFTGGAGGAVSGAGKAGAVAKALSFAGKAGRAVDPMTYIFKGAGAGFSKIGDVMAGLKGMGKFEAPSINLDGAIALPDGAVMLPDGAIHLPSGTAVPDGAVKLTDGSIKLPEGTTTFPTGTVKLPDGTSRFMDLDGNIYKADGSLDQSGKAAKQEPSPDTGADIPRVDPPKVDSPSTARVPELELAGVAARGGDNAIRLGSDISTPVHAMDNGTHVPRGVDTTPTARVGDHGTPGGHAPDNMPTNNLDNAPRGGNGDGPNGHPDTPSTARHTDGTGTGSHGDGPGAGGGRDLPGSSSADNGIPPGTAGLDALDDAARASDEAAGGAGSADDASTQGNGAGRSTDPSQTPPYKDDPRKYTDAERQTIMEHQVWRANNEPGYRPAYYRDNGYRLRTIIADESRLVPPQLVKLPDGSFVAKSALAPPLKPDYLDAAPIERAAEKATPEAVAKLNDLAKARHDAIANDKPFHDAHGDARTDLKRDPTNPDLQAAHDKAAAAHKDPHAKATKASELYGEAIAREHMIPESYPNATEHTLHGPKNGRDQFDQVWQQGDRYIVVEAKSHVDTPIGERTVNGARYSQGSRTYFLDILDQMEKRGRNPKFKSDETLAAALRTALDEGRVDYVAVRGQDNAGTYTGYTKQKFDIREIE